MKALGDESLVEAVLEDHTAAPIDARLAATLTFLEKLTLEPAALGPADVAAARDAGLSDAALAEAVEVCFAFNIMDRFADALDFPLLDGRAHRRSVGILLKLGYRLASLPG